MTLGTKEHNDVIAMFEKNFRHLRLDREKNIDLNKRGYVYESGETNELYSAFIQGYSFGRISYLN